MKRLFLFLTVVSLGVVLTGFGQEASIVGTVTDTSGAVISRGQSNCTEPSQRAHATPGNKLSGSLRGCLIAHRSLHGYGGGFRLSEARPHGHPARGGGDSPRGYAACGRVRQSGSQRSRHSFARPD